MRGLELSRRAAITMAAAVAASCSTLSSADGRSPALLVIGDSWAAGLHADPQHALGQVAAARLGWGVTVDAVSGTGYVNGAPAGQSYPDRVARLGDDVRADVVVVQGGSNDRAAGAAALAPAVRGTLDLVRDRFPSAERVVLGPGPDPLPVTSDQLAVDRVLTGVARATGVAYISVLRRHWIPSHHADAILDPANHHPTVAGQRYLGKRLAQSLRHL